MKNSEMVVTNVNGQEEVIKIFKYFKFKNSNNKYIIYTNNNENSSSVLLFAAQIVEYDNEIKLESIQNRNILHEIEKIIKKEKNTWMK